jgi:hypothetical protein
MKTFYVCSYGGSGSKMLCRALEPYGIVEHVHSRKPPENLEYIGRRGGGCAYYEWFNGIKVPDNQIDDFYVIYIYKNPVKSILSIFTNPLHLDHIQTNRNTTIQDVVDSSKDLYGVKEFYDNYTKPGSRNYKIYCVKYEDIFERQDELSELLGIGKLGLVKKETVRTHKDSDKLTEIYKDLIETMERNDFITVNG